MISRWLVLSFLIVGCGVAKDDPKALPSASPSVSTKREPYLDRSKGPFAFSAYAGPKTETKVDAARVWAVIPDAGGYDQPLNLTIADFVRTEGGAHVVKNQNDVVYEVPEALAQPIHEAPVHKGSAVRVAHAGRSALAMVTSIEASSGEVHYRYCASGAVAEGSAKPDEVLVLDEPMSFGAPVLWKGDNGWLTGTVTANGGDEAWVLTDKLQPVPHSKLHPYHFAKARKNGDKVIALFGSDLVTGTVTAAGADGIYDVKLDKSSERNAVGFPFCDIADLPEG